MTQDDGDADVPVESPVTEKEKQVTTGSCEKLNHGDKDENSAVDGGEEEQQPPPPDEERVVTYMVVPPDGGWGWVIVTASFFCNLIVDGIIFSFGMFLNEISAAFGEPKSKVAIVGSLLTGFYLMAGPFVSALANRYGFRLVTILGSVMGTIGFVVSAFSTSFTSLCLWYGVLGGIGFGLVYVPAVITTGFYFERWRALATGIAVCGSGIGTFVMAPMSTALIETFGWRGALLVQAGLVLNCAVFGALFRPLLPVRVVTTRPVDGKTSTENIPLMMRIKMARDDQLKKCDSMASFADGGGGSGVIGGSRVRVLKANNNNMYPTAAEALARSVSQLSVSKKNSSQSVSMANIAITSPTKKQKRLSVPAYPEGDAVTVKLELPVVGETTTMGSVKSLKHVPTIPELLKTVEEETRPSDENADSTEMALLQQATKRGGRRTRTTSECSTRSRRGTKGDVGAAGVRPFYRDDIFFGSSLLRLPQYTSQQSSVGYHLSVTRLPTQKDVQEEASRECSLCPEAVRRTLATMLDVSLLRSPTFLLLSVSGFITMMGFYVPFMYLTDRALVNNMDPSMAVWLISSIGITNTVGRVLCGLVSSVPGIDALLINNVALTVGGAATIISGLSMSDGYQFTYSTVFGLAMACFASLRSILIVDLLGLDRLTNAFGLLLLFQGIAATIGAPLAGAFMDATGSYDASFYLSGSLILISAILCYPLNRLNQWERRNKKQATEAV